MINGDYQLIIFDCDGTLVDSEYPNNLALCQILSEGGYEGYDLDYAYQHWVGKTLSNIFIDLRRETGLDFPQGLIAKSIDRTKQLYETELKSVPDALDVAKRVAAHYPVCVASNGERSSVLKSLSLCGFMYDDLFVEDRVFTRIQVPEGKPSPDIYLFAAEKMGISPDKTLVIEDSPTGVQAGVAAGMDVWGFTGASHDPDQAEKALLQAGAAQVFARLIHISEYLEL